MIRFDSYSVIRKAGAGGLADVYLAEVPIDAADPPAGLLPGDRVALKVLREPDRSEPSRRRFIREGLLLQRLAHPMLPRCHQVIDGARPCIVLEWLEGRTLKEAIRDEGPLPHELSLVVAEAVLTGLAFLHERGVVHRDVKPGNIFLPTDGRVLLLDLGLAADPSAPLDTTMGDVMGTYAYMAPEQIAGAAIDHRADLYSLGITLYEAVSGQRPYKARGPGGYLRAHTLGAPTPLRALREGDIPARLEELVGRLMARDPAARPQSAALALAVLTGHLAPRRALAPPPLVGRAAALGAVEAALDGGRTVHLHGEPGLGLGRLAREAWTAARGRGAELIHVRCRLGGDAMEPLLALSAGLSRIIGPVGEGPEALREALAAQVAEGPLMVIIEDLDEVEAELLPALSGVLQVPGLAALTTSTRPIARPWGHSVALRPLTRAEVHDLIAGMLGTTTAPAGMAEKLHAFSGGLPAVVVLTVRDFFERGVLECVGIGDGGATTWRQTASLRMTPDNSLRFIFRRRLEALGEEERRLLALLAVVREPLPLSMALRVARVEEGSPAPNLLAAAWLASLDEGPEEPRISVRRPALASLITAAMGEEQIRSIHAAVARELAAMPAGPWRDRRLPYHQAHGASSARAALAQVRVGEWLERQGRHAEALEVLNRASHQEGMATATAARCAALRGEVLLALSRPAEAADATLAARRLAEDLGDADALRGAVLGLARVRMHLGQLRRAMELAEEAARLADDGAAPEVVAEAALLRGRAALCMGDLEQASEAFRACMDAARRAGARQLVAHAHGGIGGVYLHSGRVEDALRVLAREAAWLRAAGQRDALVATLFDLSRARLRAGVLDEALDAVEEAERVAQETGLAPLEALAGVARANLLLRCGEAGVAGEVLRRHWLAGEADVPMFLRLHWLAARVAVRMASADGNAALASCNLLVEEANRAGWEAMRAYHAGLIAVLRAHGDDLAEALDALADLGDPQLSARLLLTGARLGGDVAVLDAAVAAARASGDRPLMLEVLHALGSTQAHAEARKIARGLLGRAPDGLQGSLRAWGPVAWALD